MWHEQLRMTPIVQSKACEKSKLRSLSSRTGYAAKREGRCIPMYLH